MMPMVYENFKPLYMYFVSCFFFVVTRGVFILCQNRQLIWMMKFANAETIIHSDRSSATEFSGVSIGSTSRMGIPDRNLSLSYRLWRITSVFSGGA